MKVLLTGADGQVGRALIQTAPGEVILTPLSRERLDIADRDRVLTLVRESAPDLIVNAAAYTHVDNAEKDPLSARRINTDGPRNLAEAASLVRARLVHLSTDFVFDGAASAPYRPEDATNPLSIYGLTKRDGEDAVNAVYPERSTTLRTSWVYAERGRNFVHTILRILQEHGTVRVVADQVGTPTAAHSVAEAIWKIVAEPGFKGLHHWTDAGVASWYDFAVAIAEEGRALGLLTKEIRVTPIPTSEYPTPARRPAYSVLDKSSLHCLGLEPRHWRTQLRNVLGAVRNG